MDDLADGAFFLIRPLIDEQLIWMPSASCLGRVESGVSAESADAALVQLDDDDEGNRLTTRFDDVLILLSLSRRF